MLENRRSIRKYTNEDVNLDNVIKVGLLSPSSKNKQPWKLIVVDDKNILKKIADCRGNHSPIIEGCNKAIIIVGDITKHEDDLWVEDCSALATTLHYQAHLEGIGSCWIQIRNRNHNDSKTCNQYLKNIFSIDDDHEVHSIITFGMSDEDKDVREPDHDKVYFNSM